MLALPQQQWSLSKEQFVCIIAQSNPPTYLDNAETKSSTKNSSRLGLQASILKKKWPHSSCISQINILIWMNFCANFGPNLEGNIGPKSVPFWDRRLEGGCSNSPAQANSNQYGQFWRLAWSTKSCPKVKQKLVQVWELILASLGPNFGFCFGFWRSSCWGSILGPKTGAAG